MQKQKSNETIMREGKIGDDLLGGLEESCVTAVADFKNASTRYNAQY